MTNSAVHLAMLTTKFEDVCIDRATIDAVHSIVTFPLLFPSAYNSGILKSEAMSGVLLYGPPVSTRPLDRVDSLVSFSSSAGYWEDSLM